MVNRARWMELNYRGQRPLGKEPPAPRFLTCLIMESSTKCLDYITSIYLPTPFLLLCLYNNKYNNHENSICLSAPITSLPPSPHSLTHTHTHKHPSTPAGGNSSKMKLRLQLTEFIKIYLCAAGLWCGKQKRYSRPFGPSYQLHISLLLDKRTNLASGQTFNITLW